MMRSRFMTVGELVALGLPTTKPEHEWGELAIVRASSLKGYYFVGKEIKINCYGHKCFKVYLVTSESVGRTYRKPSFDALVQVDHIKQISHAELCQKVAKEQEQQANNLLKLKTVTTHA